MSTQQLTYDNHGRGHKTTPPKPRAQIPYAFLFDGIQMTGFMPPSTKAPTTFTSLTIDPKHEFRDNFRDDFRDNASNASSYQTSYVSSSSSYATSSSMSYASHNQQSLPTRSPQKFSATRKTYLSDVSKFSFSPGPTYNTSPIRHFTKHPTKSCSSSAVAIMRDNVGEPYYPKSPEIDSNLPLRNICTPSNTSKVPRSTMVDWSTSPVPRFKDLHWSTKPIKKRTIMPWANPVIKTKRYPSKLPYNRRFVLGRDDRNSALGGNFVFRNQSTKNKIIELEANIRGMREKVWKTLRPRGQALLNFPKTLHEKLKEKQQREKAREILHRKIQEKKKQKRERKY